MYIYIYIYISRERERERENTAESQSLEMMRQESKMGALCIRIGHFVTSLNEWDIETHEQFSLTL